MNEKEFKKGQLFAEINWFSQHKEYICPKDMPATEHAKVVRKMQQIEAEKLCDVVIKGDWPDHVAIETIDRKITIRAHIPIGITKKTTDLNAKKVIPGLIEQKTTDLIIDKVEQNAFHHYGIK